MRRNNVQESMRQVEMTGPRAMFGCLKVRANIGNDFVRQSVRMNENANQREL